MLALRVLKGRGFGVGIADSSCGEEKGMKTKKERVLVDIEEGTSSLFLSVFFLIFYAFRLVVSPEELVSL